MISSHNENGRVSNGDEHRDQKPKKHDIVLWEAYNEDIYKLVEKTKDSKFWNTDEAFTYSLSKEMLEAINQSGQDDYFLSETYTSHENTTTL